MRNDANADAGLIARGDAQLGALVALARQLDSASPVALAMMRAAVAASVAASATLAQQASASASTSGPAGNAASLASASAEARNAVSSFERDMYERKIFDPYLHFASKEEEAAYRQREAERQEETDKAKQANTPEGNLRAAQLSIEQMHDAGAHGATASPQFEKTLSGLSHVVSNLAQQIDTRAQELQTKAAPSPDHLDQVKPAVNVSPDLVASLRAAGVIVADQSQNGHGVPPSANVTSTNLTRA